MLSHRLLAIGLAMCLGGAGMLTTVSVLAADGAAPKEELFITGSRIGRDKYALSSPVDVFNTEDLRLLICIQK